MDTQCLCLVLFLRLSTCRASVSALQPHSSPLETPLLAPIPSSFPLSCTHAQLSLLPLLTAEPVRQPDRRGEHQRQLFRLPAQHGGGRRQGLRIPGGGCLPFGPDIRSLHLAQAVRVGRETAASSFGGKRDRRNPFFLCAQQQRASLFCKTVRMMTLMLSSILYCVMHTQFAFWIAADVPVTACTLC